MKHIHFLPVLVVLATGACVVDEPILGATSLEIQKQTIIDQGGTCIDATNGSLCTLCKPDIHHPETTVCEYYACDTNGNCEKSVTATDLGDMSVWIEAEDGDLTSPMQVATSNGASSGQAVLVSSSITAPGGSVRFTFEVPTGGRTFYAWGRTAASSTSTNEFEFRIDNGSYKLWNLPVGGGWVWTRIADASAPPGSSSGFFLPAGTHTLRIYRREAGAQLDRVMLTTSATFVPNVQSAEAESLPYVAPMQVDATSRSPLATRFMWVPTGSTASGGSFDLNLTLPSDGFYSVWGRVNAPSASQNSFYASANFDPRALWVLPVTASTEWRWDQVTDSNDGGAPLEPFFDAGASLNFLRFERRETGAKIDRLIVTNDPAFVPVDDAPPGYGW